ncbi:hypothetical protein IPZ70_15730 [Streptomyces polychromogenes]|nr:hypothetical protein [Streptomyces polychromogenes]
MTTPGAMEDLAQAVEDVRDLMARLAAHRRRHPGDDPITAWLIGGGHAPGTEEVAGLAFGLWWAGIENTAHHICLAAEEPPRRQGPVLTPRRASPAMRSSSTA